MYIDPPYPDNKCNYKHNMRSWEDHMALAERLSRTRCKWILSSYDTPPVHGLYDRYHIRPIQSFSGMKAKKDGEERVLNREVLVTNYSLADEMPIKAERPKQFGLNL